MTHDKDNAACPDNLPSHFEHATPSKHCTCKPEAASVEEEYEGGDPASRELWDKLQAKLDKANTVLTEKDKAIAKLERGLTKALALLDKANAENERLREVLRSVPVWWAIH